jgi:HAE1 family hydrophobic/amphiphilic exporter-1
LRFFLKHSVLTHTLFFFLIILSIMSYNRIAKELFPPSSLDKISITGAYVGASSDTLNKIAVKPIEDDIKNYSEVASIESTILNGSFTIVADIKPNSDLNSLQNDFKTVVANTKQNLPSDMNEPTVTLVKKAFPLITVTIAGNIDRFKLLDIADDLKQKLLVLKDLSKIQIDGKGDKELIINLNSDKIKTLNLDESQVASAISNISSIMPIGKIEGKNQYYLSMKNIKNLDNIRNTILTINGKKVYLKDISDIKYDIQTPVTLGKFNGVKDVSLTIKKGETGDAIALTKQIRKITKEFAKSYPNLKFGFSMDTSVWVKNRLNTVVSNIEFGLLLVFFAMWLFINKRISFVVTIGIPTSFAIALIILDFAHLSLNLLSMLGALIALGMIVDEAIVVAENIQRHMEMGKDRMTAAIDGAKEVFWPVLTSALTTIFAFLPLLMIQGEIGIFMKIIPVMITVLILSSVAEAFIFLPLHSKETLRPEEGTKEKLWEKINFYYEKILTFIIRFKWISLALFLLGIPALIAVGMKHSKFQLFPDFDTTQIYVNGSCDSNNTIYDTFKQVSQVEAVLKKHLGGNEIKSFTTIVGMKLNGKSNINSAANNFQIFLDLYDRKPTDIYNKYIAPFLNPVKENRDDVKRDKSAQEIVLELQKEYKKMHLNIPELNVKVPGVGIVKSDIVIMITENNIKKVSYALNKIESKLKEIKGVRNIYDDATMGAKLLKIKINNYGEELGINQGYIVSALRPYFSEGEFGKTIDNDVIKIKLKDVNRDSLSFLQNFRINIPNTNQYILLNRVANFYIENNFQKLNKYDGILAKSVYASVNHKLITTNEVYKKLQPVLDRLKKEGIHYKIGGAKKVSSAFMKDMKYAGVLALILIFITLVAMFDSVLLPFVVISVIPLSFLGVIIGNFLVGINFTMIGMIGVVGLFGVAVNDGIIMIEFIRNAKNIDELINKAKFRVRPILLTSITTILGLSTLMFYPFGQSVILQPLAVAIGFGVAFSTILNLFYLPLFFAILRKIK